jgi:hypothetical protein
MLLLLCSQRRTSASNPRQCEKRGIAAGCRRPCSSDLSTKKSLAAISPFTVLRRPVALRSGSPGRAIPKALGQSTASLSGCPSCEVAPPARRPQVCRDEPFSRWSAIGYPSRWLGLSWIDRVSCSDGGSVEPHERGAPDGLLGFLRSQFAPGSSVEWVWVIMPKHHEDQ